MITGASSGIGEATALSLAPARSRIALLARRADELERVAAAVRAAGSEALVLPVDLRDHTAARTAAEEVVATWGAPEVVVANAGHSIARPVLETVDRFDSYERTVDVNYLGAVAVLLPCLRAMAAARRGHVVGVTTVNARIPAPGWSPYCASKAAFDAWLRSVRPELLRVGVRTSIIEFPLVRTPMMAPVYGEHGGGPGVLSPEQAAGWVARAIATGRPMLSPWWVRPAAVLTAAAPSVSAQVVGLGSMRRRPRRRDAR